MRGAQVTLREQPPLDPFLQAEVGEGENGMPISVRSALARQGIDPDAEAAHLAGMPAEEARRLLTRLVAKAQNGRWNEAECRCRASRLLALLPVHSPLLAPPLPALRRAWERLWHS